jgi:ParB-like chromosome segregation protein Spo0J
MEILIKSTTSMQLHSLTETHPVMSIEQYEAFKADIAKNGQMQPVIAYRDKIVDGRHRLRA